MKIDRLVGILTVLLRQGSATAPELAARFEVSRRTISRDVEDLCRAGIPLVTTQGYGGGISIAEGYRLRPDLLTREELETLLAGLGGMGTVTRGPHITTLLEKLPPGEGAIAIDLASHYRDTLTGKIALLRQCIREKRLVTFRYWYRKGPASGRWSPTGCSTAGGIGTSGVGAGCARTTGFLSCPGCGSRRPAPPSPAGNSPPGSRTRTGTSGKAPST